MEPITERRWRLREPDPDVVAGLTKGTGLAPLQARILANRGIEDPAAARRFLTASLAELDDPFLLLGMEQAVTRLVRAWQAGERVCVYGDYDVDGITAVALLIGFFRAVAIDCCYVIPRRLEDGYGLSREGLDEAVRKGAGVVVTVDCGITAVAEARYAAEQGIDLIITDHHTPADLLPEVPALLNPLQPGCPSPFKSLAGVGLAFKLLIALRSRLREAGCFRELGEPNLREFLDLVALGTIADLVPLTGENRIFVRHGLRELTAAQRLGVRALKEVAGVTGEVNCGAVGFRLAPRLNAAGRLDDAALGVELLLCRDEALAAQMAAELDAGNRERQELEQAILRDALAKVQGDPSMTGRTSLVLASADWHPGVIGIVASRLVDIYHRPTILIALQDGQGKGSGRSIPRFHLHDALKACTEHLLKFGGHKQAAGLSVSEETLAAFVESFDRVTAGLLEPDDLTPELALDAELAAAEVNGDLVELVGQLAPFGMGNPEPLFLLRGCTVTGQRQLQGGHLRLSLRKDGITFAAIGFAMAGRPPQGNSIDLAFSPQFNDWRGERSVQLRIKDFKEAGPAPAGSGNVEK